MVKETQEYHPWDGVYRTFKIDMPNKDKPKDDEELETSLNEE